VQQDFSEWSLTIMPTMLFAMLVFFTHAPVTTQLKPTELQAKLDARVSQYSLSATSLADALLRTSEQFQVPMGIEWVKNRDTLRPLTRTWRDETVWQVLRSIVEDYPDYAFRVEEGVIHVFRHDMLDDNRNFLNLKVPNFFEVRHETGGFANQQLQSVVQNIVSPRNLPPGVGEAGSYTSGNVREKPLNVSLRGATVREALGKLAEASEHKVWLVTFSDTSTLTKTGFYRTETLWHPRPFPFPSQPMWDFLAWGQDQPH
jgi:hypothetical protein